MDNNISTILEKLYNNDLSFNDACNKISNLLLEKINEEIYDEVQLVEKNNYSIGKDATKCLRKKEIK